MKGGGWTSDVVRWRSGPIHPSAQQGWMVIKERLRVLTYWGMLNEGTNILIRSWESEMTKWMTDMEEILTHEGEGGGGNKWCCKMAVRFVRPSAQQSWMTDDGRDGWASSWRMMHLVGQIRGMNSWADVDWMKFLNPLGTERRRFKNESLLRLYCIWMNEIDQSILTQKLVFSFAHPFPLSFSLWFYFFLLFFFFLCHFLFDLFSSRLSIHSLAHAFSFFFLSASTTRYDTTRFPKT